MPSAAHLVREAPPHGSSEIVLGSAAGARESGVRILQLVSCRGWSSDAYWAARASRELERRGHHVVLGVKRGTEAKVVDRARREGIRRIERYQFASGFAPRRDVADVRRLAARMATTDIVHVHRGKEHWLAALASRLRRSAPPIVRTRHIAQSVRPHAGNRWLYRHSTALVVTVSEAIRRQYLAAGLMAPDRIVALPGGADAETLRPRPVDQRVRERLGGTPGGVLVGMVGGLRVMKGHAVVLEAVTLLSRRGVHASVAFIGRGSMEAPIRAAITRGDLTGSVVVGGFAEDLATVMATLDVALYVPLESDGMSRVLFEYLAAGRPVIASRTGVVPEVLTDGVDGLLVPAGDAEALADALARVVQDAALRARLGRAGRELLETRYSGARLARSLEHHYAGIRGR